MMFIHKGLDSFYLLEPAIRTIKHYLALINFKYRRELVSDT